MTVSIIGLGLIGGSLAKAIKNNTEHKVLGFDKSEAVIMAAYEENAIDDVCAGFEDTDIAFIALYPDAAVDFLKSQANGFKSGTVIIDLCGVKRYVCDSLRGIFPEGVIFIGGHPMAGRECSGFENSISNMFDNASMILTPDDDILLEDIERVCEFLTDSGFLHVEVTSPERHDEMIAYTSQLAHIVSSAYIKSPLLRKSMNFSAGSFKDMTRVAKLNEDMWTSLFLHNGDFLTDKIDALIKNLTDYRDAIANNDADTLQNLLCEGRELKEAFDMELFV